MACSRLLPDNFTLTLRRRGGGGGWRLHPVSRQVGQAVVLGCDYNLAIALLSLCRCQAVTRGDHCRRVTTGGACHLLVLSIPS